MRSDWLFGALGGEPRRTSCFYFLQGNCTRQRGGGVPELGGACQVGLLQRGANLWAECKMWWTCSWKWTLYSKGGGRGPQLHQSPNRGNCIKKSISKHKVQLIFVLLGASHYWEGGFEIKTRWRTPLTLRHEVGWDGQDYISWRLGCSWSRANLQFWVAANVNFRPLGFPCVFYVHIVPSVISRFNKRHGSHCIDDINQVYYINSASFFLHHSKIYVGAFRSSLWLINSKGFPCR